MITCTETSLEARSLGRSLTPTNHNTCKNTPSSVQSSAPLPPTPNPFTPKIRCRSSSPLSHSSKGIETYALSHSKTRCATSTPTQPSPQLSLIKHLPTVHNTIAIRSLPLTGRNLSNLHPDILSLVQREIQLNRISRQQSIFYCHNGRRIIPQQKTKPPPMA